MNKAPAFTIRVAQIDELQTLENLIPDSVRALSKEFYSEAQIEGGIQEIFGVDTQLIHDGTYYVVEVDGHVAACGGWSKRKTTYGADKMKQAADNLLDPQKDPARVRAFFVDPKWARRGIGKGLLERCIKDAKAAGFTAIFLVATLPGEQLYKRYGFEVIRRHDHQLSSGLDFPIVDMQKKLNSWFFFVDYKKPLMRLPLDVAY